MRGGFRHDFYRSGKPIVVIATDIFAGSVSGYGTAFWKRQCKKETFVKTIGEMA